MSSSLKNLLNFSRAKSIFYLIAGKPLWTRMENIWLTDKIYFIKINLIYTLCIKRALNVQNILLSSIFLLLFSYWLLSLYIILTPVPILHVLRYSAFSCQSSHYLLNDSGEFESLVCYLSTPVLQVSSSSKLVEKSQIIRFKTIL